MGRIEDSWERIVQSVACPICGAVEGAPCINAYGRVFYDKGHYERRQEYYQLRQKIKNL